MPDEYVYYAYGSNLSHEQMQRRCSGAEPIGAGRLIGYRLIFAGMSERWGGAVADVMEDPEWYVQGGLYRLCKEHMDSLDGFEGHPHFYARQEMEILIPSGEKVNAWIYKMVEQHKRGKPSRSYLETIIKGFYDFKLTPPPEVSAAEYVE